MLPQLLKLLQQLIEIRLPGFKAQVLDVSEGNPMLCFSSMCKSHRPRMCQTPGGKTTNIMAHSVTAPKMELNITKHAKHIKLRPILGHAPLPNPIEISNFGSFVDPTITVELASGYASSPTSHMLQISGSRIMMHEHLMLHCLGVQCILRQRTERSGILRCFHTVT